MGVLKKRDSKRHSKNSEKAAERHVALLKNYNDIKTQEDASELPNV